MRNFLQHHPDSLCVSLGAGLDLAGSRIANGMGHAQFDWVDVDLPDVTALKTRLLPPHITRQLVSADMRKAGWKQQLPTPAGRSVLIRAEGLLMYLEPECVAQIMRELAQWSSKAPQLRMVFDWVSPLGKNLSRWHPSLMKTTMAKQRRSPFAWGMRSLDELSALLAWQRHADYDLMDAVGGKMRYANQLHRWCTGLPIYGCQTLDRDVSP